MSYPGDGLFATANSNAVIVTVAGAATVSVLTANPTTFSIGTPVTLAASVTSSSPGTITGVVTFYLDGTLLSSAAVANGAAAVTAISQVSGMHSFTCAYSGDTMFAASKCACVSVSSTNFQTALTLVSSATPAPALSSVTFTAKLTPQSKPSTANILFVIDGVSTKLVITDTNGIASYSTPLPVGPHTVKAQFAGTDGYDASNASLTQVQLANPTTTTLTPPAGAVYPNQHLTLLSSVNAIAGTSSPNGTVTLSEGATLLAQATSSTSISGITATTVHLDVPALSVGAHLLIANYTPADGNFLASSSHAISVVAVPQGFKLSISSPTLSIVTEYHKTFSASVQSISGFSGPVQLTCAVPPNVYLSCGLSTSSLQLTANGSVATELTVDTDAALRFKSSLEADPRPMVFSSYAIAVALLFPLPFGLLTWRRRGRVSPLLLLFFALGATVCISGCGDKYPAHTPPGTYDITITAIGTPAGSTVTLTQTEHLELTVLPGQK